MFGKALGLLTGTACSITVTNDKGKKETIYLNAFALERLKSPPSKTKRDEISKALSQSVRKAMIPKSFESADVSILENAITNSKKEGFQFLRDKLPEGKTSFSDRDIQKCITLPRDVKNDNELMTVLRQWQPEENKHSVSESSSGIESLRQKPTLGERMSPLVKSVVVVADQTTKQKKFMQSYVKKYLKPYITGKITPENENTKRNPLIQDLEKQFKKEFPKSTLSHSKLEGLAFQEYLEEGARGCVEFYAQRKTTKDHLIADYAAVLQHALPIDFNGSELIPQNDAKYLQCAQIALKNKIPSIQKSLTGTFDQNKHLEDAENGKLKYSIKNRRVPPLGSADTMRMVNGKYESVHGQGICFAENEIVSTKDIIACISYKYDENRSISCSRYDPKKSTVAVENQIAEKLDNGKYMIRQLSTRGCTAATSMMLIADKLGLEAISVTKLLSTYLGTAATQKQTIEEAGLEFIEPPFSQESIDKNGSGCLSIDDPQLGGHVIIIDAIDVQKKTVDIREPYHGIAMTITLDALNARHPCHWFQAVKKSDMK